MARDSDETRHAMLVTATTGCGVPLPNACFALMLESDTHDVDIAVLPLTR